jgi:hypothetical protein
MVNKTIVNFLPSFGGGRGGFLPSLVERGRGRGKKQNKMKKLKLFIAFLAMVLIGNNSTYGQCSTTTPLPSNMIIDTQGCYDYSALITPTPEPPTTIDMDIAEVDPSTDVHIWTNMTNPTWVLLPSGHINAYGIYSSYVRPSVPGPYDVVGDQGVMKSRMRFVTTLKIQFFNSGGGQVGPLQDIPRGTQAQTINAPIGATHARVELPVWFTGTGSNLGSNVLMFNTLTLIDGGNKSSYTLSQSGNYQCRTRDGYGPNQTDTTNFILNFAPPTTYTLTPSAGTNGSITPSTVQTVNAGENKTFTFTPDNGYEVDEVKVNGSPVTVVGNSYTFTNVQANHTVNVTFRAIRYTLTVNSGTGSGNYEAGAQVAITANAAPTGKVFDKWTGGNGGSFADVNAANTTFTMPSNAATVTATYKDAPPVTYTLTVNSGTGSGNYEAGAQVNISANAAPTGKVFDKWTGGAGGSFADVNAANTTFTMPANAATVTATYKDAPVVTYPLTVNSGTGSGNYEAGAQVSISANAAPSGKVFDKWTGGTGGSFADVNAANTTFTMPANAATVTATYKDAPPVTYTLTVQNGTGSGNYEAGAQVSISANAAPSGKVFDKWTGGAGGSFADVNAANTTFTMPANAATITATYKDAPPVSPVPVFDGLEEEYTAGSPAVALKVKGTGSEHLTVFKVNGQTVTSFNPAAKGNYEIVASSTDGKLKISRTIKVK